MKLYKLTPEQCDAINAFNETQKNTLLIVCDHGDGDIGVDADALKSNPKFAEWLTKLGEAYDVGKEKIVELDVEGDKK